MAVKTFKYAVIYDGKFYRANTPIEVKKQEEQPTKKKAVKKDDRATSNKS